MTRQGRIFTIMRRMWPGRTIAAALALAAGCASLPPPEERLPAEVGAQLDRRGLGPDALLIIGNLVSNGPPAPRATPSQVMELIARPLDAVDAAAVFRRSVPPSLGGFAPAAPQPFPQLLKTYLEELARAQQLLGGATGRFDEDLLLR